MTDQNDGLDDPCLVCRDEDACQARREEHFPPASPAWGARQDRALDRVTSADAVVDAIRALGSLQSDRVLSGDVVQLTAAELAYSGPARRHVAAHELAHVWVAWR